MKIRNFIGAAVIALAVMLNPAPAESAPAGPDRVSCIIIRRVPGNPELLFRVFFLPRSVAVVLDEMGIASCAL
jgi:hypothetical protein